MWLYLCHSNYVTLGLGLALLVLIYFGSTAKNYARKLFLVFISMTILLNLSEIAAYLASLKDISSPQEHFFLACGYALRPATLLVLLHLFVQKKKVLRLLYLPIIFNALAALTSYYTHWLFWYDAGGNFYRGPLGFLPHIVSIAYLTLVVFVSVKKYRWHDPGETLLIFYLAIFCMAASELETLCGLKFVLSSAMMGTGALYYIYLLTQVYKHDYLTHLLNRHMFFQDADNWHESPLSVISIDLNRLKELNDQHGHKAGDQALKCLAAILTEAAQNDYRVYRLGGDEFMVLGKGKTAAEAAALIRQVQEKLKTTPYMASFGLAMYEPGQDFDSVCIEADQNMYHDKDHYPHRSYLRRST